MSLHGNGGGSTNLEGPADTEDTVVGLLGRQTLERLLDGLGLFGDQVVRAGCCC